MTFNSDDARSQLLVRRKPGAPDTLSYRVREAMGISQRELAELLTVSEYTVSRWETGVFNPSRLALRALEKLARKHGVKAPD